MIVMRRGRPPRPALERFWEKVDKGADGECWPWTGTLVLGYGVFCLGHGKKVKAHRYMYKIIFGDIGDKLVIHICGNKRCCNPLHLKLGLYKDRYYPGRDY
jgi:hypothetical protein